MTGRREHPSRPAQAFVDASFEVRGNGGMRIAAQGRWKVVARDVQYISPRVFSQFIFTEDHLPNP